MKKAIIILIALCPLAALAQEQTYTLEQCVSMAIEHSYELKSGRIDLQMSEQTQKEAFTHYFPVISANGGGFKASEYLIDESIDLTPFAKVFAMLGLNPATLGLPASMPIQKANDGVVGFVSATQPIFMGGQILNGNRLAKVGREASELKMNTTADEVQFKTEDYFWQIVALKEKLVTIGVVEKQLNEIHRTVATAVATGVRNRNDLLRVEIQQQSIASARVRAENGIRVYKLLLCNLTGANAVGFDVSVTSMPDVKNPSVDSVSTTHGLDLRPESLLLDKGVEAATLRYKMAVGKNLPTVVAGAGYMYHNVMDKDASMGLVYATVNIPISAWWGGSHAMQKERLSMAKAENDRLNMRELLLVDIESKWNELLESYLQAQLAAKSIESSEDNLRISTDCFNAGTVSLTDLLEAQTLVQQSHDQRTEATIKYHLKHSAYLKATGRYGN